ncbi:MAG: pantetheine-phosphate adenylyltransferase [Patescibacteria group bacterium]
MEFNLVVCGGTFDHFHKGHRKFLQFALSLSNKLVVGLTSDTYSGNKELSFASQSYEERKKTIEEFLKKENFLERVEMLKIEDMFGPTLSETFNAQAIIVSSSTLRGAEIINEHRKKQGLSEFKIIIQPTILGPDDKQISSLRIRNGEIDREGKPYVNPLWLKQKLFLTEEIRKRLERPFGVLVENFTELASQKFPFVITVGDVTAKKFNDLSLKQNIAVIDFKVGRKVMFSKIEELGFLGNETIIKVNNPASCLTPDIFKEVQNALKQGLREKVIIKIGGEEDLAVLPLILASPLGTSIYYGQPNEGMVRIEVSENIKKIAYGLVDGFEMKRASTRGY